MSYVGVTIGEYDTLEAWGLILAADLSISAPKVKETFISIPGGDGSINLTGALTDGELTYEDRPIDFTLLKGVDEYDLHEILVALYAYAHGKTLDLKLPLYEGYHFNGYFIIGKQSGFNRGKIAVNVNANPWALKDGPTVITQTITGHDTIILSNEQRKVAPSFHADGAVNITFGTAQYALAADTDTIFPALLLSAGDNNISVSAASGTNLTITYQEARL